MYDPSGLFTKTGGGYVNAVLSSRGFKIVGNQLAESSSSPTTALLSLTTALPSLNYHTIVSNHNITLNAPNHNIVLYTQRLARFFSISVHPWRLSLLSCS